MIFKYDQIVIIVPQICDFLVSILYYLIFQSYFIFTTFKRLAKIILSSCHNMKFIWRGSPKRYMTIHITGLVKLHLFSSFNFQIVVFFVF